jgi:hypothetical protein
MSTQVRSRRCGKDSLIPELIVKHTLLSQAKVKNLSIHLDVPPEIHNKPRARSLLPNFKPPSNGLRVGRGGESRVQKTEKVDKSAMAVDDPQVSDAPCRYDGDGLRHDRPPTVVQDEQVMIADEDATRNKESKRVAVIDFIFVPIDNVRTRVRSDDQTFGQGALLWHRLGNVLEAFTD